MSVGQGQIVNWNPENSSLAKKTVANGITEQEFELFKLVCNRSGLDPFMKQIYAISRSQWDEDAQGYIKKMSIQVGIDGLRIVAHRTKDAAGESMYNGSGDLQYYDGATKTWVDVWADAKVMPHACRMNAYRKGAPPIPGIVYYDAMVQRKKAKAGEAEGPPTKKWQGMSGVSQLAKCCEAAVLRKAFPQETSGIYIHEEMEHLDSEAEEKNREKEKTLEAFIENIPAEIKQRLDAYGYNNRAKVAQLCEEAGNTFEGLAVQLQALEFIRTMDESLKEKVKAGGYKNQPEVRRLIVKVGPDVAKLNLYLETGVLPVEVLGPEVKS